MNQNIFESQRYLLVDDFQGIRTMLREILKYLGVKQIDSAANAKEALALLNRNKYDVVMCDYNLGPGKNGQQILEEAKVKSLIGPATAWIILTAEKTSDMVYGAADFLPDDYLIKPITENAVRERLVKVLAKKADLYDIEKAIRAKDLALAVSLCDVALKSSKSSQNELLKIKTGLLYEMERYDEAEKVYGEILARRDVSWARTGLAKISMQRGNFQEAKYLLQEVVEQNPSYLEAYDLLARAHQELNELDEAQIVIQRSVEISPLSLARQKRLGEIAMNRGDMDVAENAYRKSVKLGEHSVMKSADSYLNLAKICVEKDNPVEAMKLLKDVSKDFDAREAQLQAKVLEVDICRKTGDDAAEKKATEALGAMLMGDNRNLPADVAIGAAEILLSAGNKDTAMKLMQSVVDGNNEDEKLLGRVMKTFAAAGIEDEGRQLVEKSKKEAAETNNRAVALAREGKHEEAIEFLRDAKLMMPNSKQILLNFAFVANLYMQKNGKNDSLMREARDCLDRVGKLDPQEKKRLQIREMLDAVQAKN